MGLSYAHACTVTPWQHSNLGTPPNSVPMNNSTKPVVQHIPDFLDYCEIEKGLASLTQENYGRYLSVFVKWLKNTNKESVLPHELTPEDLWNYHLFLARKYKTPQGEYLQRVTQHYYLVALRALLNYFSEKDISAPSSSKVSLPKDSREKSIKFLNLEQLKQLLEAPDVSRVQGLRDRAIMETLFSTGLRIAELVALNRNQIPKQTQDWLELTIKGKGGNVRTIYFSSRALQWVKKYLETRTDMDSALFINYRSSNADSLRLSSRSIESAVKKYSLVAGLPIAVTPHTLRHSYATDLLTQGVDLRTVQEFLGHKDIATTQLYTHITNKRLRDIHKKFHGGSVLS